MALSCDQIDRASIETFVYLFEAFQLLAFSSLTAPVILSRFLCFPKFNMSYLTYYNAIPLIFKQIFVTKRDTILVLMDPNFNFQENHYILDWCSSITDLS